MSAVQILNELLPLINLVLIPIFIYVVKLERKLAIFEVKGDGIERQLRALDLDVRAFHRRLDNFGVPPASGSGT